MLTLLLAIIFLAFISLGLPDSLLGAAWPTMRIDLNMPISAAGLISMIICSGTIVSALFSDKLEKKIKTPFVVSISILITAVAIYGFSISNQYWMLCIFGIPYGLGAGAIDSALNSYVAKHYSSRHMSWLHAFWGIGAIISPFIMGYALTYKSSWNLGYRYVSFLQFIIAVILFISIPLWFKIKKKENEKEIDNERLYTFKEKFKINGILFLLIGFFSYCALESTTLNWASTYMNQAKGISEEKAASLASLTYIGITLSRIILGMISAKLGDKKMIRLGIFIIFVGVILLFVPVNNIYLSFAGFMVIGFGCGPIYPSIVHSTPNNFGIKKCNAVFGLQMASAYLGSTLMSPFFGVLCQVTSVRIFPIYILLLNCVLFVMLEIMNKKVLKECQ